MSMVTQQQSKIKSSYLKRNTAALVSVLFVLAHTVVVNETHSFVTQ